MAAVELTPRQISSQNPRRCAPVSGTSIATPDTIIMIPILTRYGGQFGYDLTVASVLRSPVSHPITRVFTIVFPSRAVREAFFADPEYLAARQTHFVSAVDGFSVMAEEDRGVPA